MKYLVIDRETMVGAEVEATSPARAADTLSIPWDRAIVRIMGQDDLVYDLRGREVEDEIL